MSRYTVEIVVRRDSTVVSKATASAHADDQVQALDLLEMNVQKEWTNLKRNAHLAAFRK